MFSPINSSDHLDKMIHDERMYSVQEVQGFMNRSDDLVRNIFRKEDECIKISNPRPGVRPYVTLMIPGWLVKRVFRRMML